MSTATVNGYEIKPYANLQGANLRGADLRGANLEGADLRGANLEGADLWRANLRGANLEGADLRGADLWGANLRRANLWGANLWGANLWGANLWGANLRRANLRPWAIVPTEGAFVAFKKLSNGTVAKLLIPEDAKRISTPVGRKCRASKAVVLEGAGRASWDTDFIYEQGATVQPKEPFDDDWRVECASGIHFFITREEAESY